MIQSIRMSTLKFFVGMGSNGVVIQLSYRDLMNCQKYLRNFHWKMEKTMADAQERAYTHMKAIMPRGIELTNLIPLGKVVTVNQLRNQQKEKISGSGKNPSPVTDTIGRSVSNGN